MDEESLFVPPGAVPTLPTAGSLVVPVIRPEVSDNPVLVESPSTIEQKVSSSVVPGYSPAASSTQKLLEDSPDADEKTTTTSLFGLLSGPLLGLASWALLTLLAPHGLSQGACRLAGMTLWIAAWWLFEPIPLGITSLIPIIAFPLARISTVEAVSQQYSLPLMWMFFGGFQLAFALQKAGLHKRIALHVMQLCGTAEALLMLGIMLSVAFLSMFLSNTSTTLMIVPVAQAIVGSLDETSSSDSSSDSSDGSSDLERGQVRPGGGLFKPLMLGIAYSASVGGLGSLIGTPPNGVLAVQGIPFGINISFARWAAFAMPFSFLTTILLWLYFVFQFKVSFQTAPGGQSGLRKFALELGSMSQAEARVAAIFVLTVAGWISRKSIVQALALPPGYVEDATISLSATVALFLVSAKYKDGKIRKLLDWELLLTTPWQLIFLFGGGFALASAFETTGLSLWVGQQMTVFKSLPAPLVVLLAVLLVTFLTEVTSNTATANVLLPILGEMANSIGMAPALLMVPATMACSCAFMMPTATPPNAIIFATGAVSIKEMARTGLLVNFATSFLITAWIYLWGPFFFDFSGPSSVILVPTTDVLAVATANATTLLTSG
mmetsp:Transcript_38056/g.80571  ORF Transcript_38056/g.80571 Transcript_38056/m.80571 type:complete len:607 (-) Transcript_38056:49-1869(-)